MTLNVYVWKEPVQFSVIRVSLRRKSIIFVPQNAFVFTLISQTHNTESKDECYLTLLYCP